MVEIPHSLLDFSDALRLLAESQSDVVELVTKWDELCDTTNPKSITITVGGVQHEVDNLAKIRQDLIQGLSLDNPRVSTLSFSQKRASAYYDATRRYMMTFNESDEDEFGAISPGSGVVETMRNVIRTIACPAESRLNVNLLDLPSVVFLGVPKNTGGTPIYTYDIYVKAPYSTEVEKTRMHAYHYYTVVKFVNRTIGTLSGDVTINLRNETGNLLSSKVISPLKYSEFLFFATPGQNTVNIQEMIPDIPTA